MLSAQLLIERPEFDNLSFIFVIRWFMEIYTNLKVLLVWCTNKEKLLCRCINTKKKTQNTQSNTQRRMKSNEKKRANSNENSDVRHDSIERLIFKERSKTDVNTL